MRGRIGLVFVLAFALGTLGACTDTERPERILVLGDQASYASLVQPYVGLRCGSLDCHGDLGRSLRIYAEDGLRLRAALRGEPVSAEEIQRNLEAFAGASPDISTPAEHIALVKGLAVAAGGFAHVGGDVWVSTGEPGYQCILAWLEDRAEEMAAQDACIAAFQEVAP